MSEYRWQSMPASSKPALEVWSRLHVRYGLSPLLHVDFLKAALQWFGSPTIRMHVCTHEDQPVAACVLDTAGALRRATFQPSQAPIGFWLQRADAPTTELMRALARTQPPWVLSLAVTQQDPFLLARPSPSGALLPTDYIDTARISIASDWDSYWKARGSNLRHNVKRANAKVRGVGRQLEMRMITDVLGMREAVRSYGEIESRSWKATEGTAVSPENDQGRFYTQLLELFAKRGQARCYQLLVDGKVAATDLCVCGDEELVILKTTFDEAYRDYSPAFLLREMAFSALFSESWCKRIEFYGRVRDWHLRWTDEVRRMYHVSAFRYPGTLALWKAIKRVKKPADEVDAAAL